MDAYQRELEILENEFAAGEINDKEYKSKMREIEGECRGYYTHEHPQDEYDVDKYGR